MVYQQNYIFVLSCMLSASRSLRTMLIICCLAATAKAVCQTQPAPRTFHGRNGVLLSFNFAQQYPFGDLSKRFGSHPSVGFGTSYKTASGWQFEFGLNTVFGSTVKENTMFDSITGPSGDLIDANGNLAIIRLYERGFQWHLSAGKLIPLTKRNENSGLLLSAGVGFMQHKIKFSYYKGVLPQLDNGMYKGYDRLSNGLMLRQWAGYQYMDRKGRINVFGGFELLEGFTKNRREINYDTRTRDTRQRMDILLGFKCGLIIPIYGKRGKKGAANNEEIFYE